MSEPVVVDWGGEALELRPDRSALLRGHRTLLVADVHLGKARAFRQQGLPVPGGTTGETLARLAAAVRASGAERLVFLGDLLHSRHAQGSASLDEFARWRAAHASLALMLVRGNHDAHAGDPPAGLDIDVVEEPFALGGVALCHHPRPEATPRESPPRPGRVARVESRSFMAEALELAVPEDEERVTRARLVPTLASRRRAAARAGMAPGSASDSASGPAPARPRIAGHVHPCTHLSGRTDSLRLPCFHFSDGVAVLPAFGAFTGMHAVRPAPGDRLWVVAGDRVVAVPRR